MKREITDKMNIFPKHISDKGSICKIYRAFTIKQEHKNLNLLKLDKMFKQTLIVGMQMSRSGKGNIIGTKIISRGAMGLE